MNEQILGEVAAVPELGCAQINNAHARHEAALAIAIPPDSISAVSVRLI